MLVKWRSNDDMNDGLMLVYILVESWSNTDLSEWSNIKSGCTFAKSNVWQILDIKKKNCVKSRTKVKVADKTQRCVFFCFF